MKPEWVYPTHVGRNEKLLREAIDLANEGAFVDLDVTEQDVAERLRFYIEEGGPMDKLFTIVIQDTAGQGPRMTREALGDDKSLDYLADRTMGDLLLAEADATAATLIKNGRPTRLIRIATLDEKVLGALMMHYILETIIAGELLGVDAFDQPAVEDAKVLTRQYLSQRRKS